MGFSLLLALGTVLAGACGLRLGSDPGRARLPIGLLTDGSAFARPGARNDVVHALERVTHRRVLLLGAPVSREEASVKDLAARITKEHRALGRYDWREPRCTSHADVLTAVQRDVDAVYRVSLEYSEHTRPLTEAESALDRGGFLRAVHLAQAGIVREESLSGTVTMSSFAPEATRRASVSRIVKEVEPSAFSSRLAIGDAVAEAFAELPAAPDPEWEPVARKLVSGGCPFLALVVAETRLKPAGADAAVRKAALATVNRGSGKRTSGRPTRESVAKASVQRDADDQGDAEPPPGDDRYSCNSLCGMHMVQLCNNDKVLWSSHRAKWETTPCGTRRSEAFLRECYQQQWLSSTFRDACLQPCENTSEGRDRLMQILRDAGCVRSGTS